MSTIVVATLGLGLTWPSFGIALKRSYTRTPENYTALFFPADPPVAFAPFDANAMEIEFAVTNDEHAVALYDYHVKFTDQNDDVVGTTSGSLLVDSGKTVQRSATVTLSKESWYAAEVSLEQGGELIRFLNTTRRTRG